MSAFKTIKTNMKNLDHLIDALGRVKKEWIPVMQDKKNVDPSGNIHLIGYQGDDRALLPKTNDHYAPPCLIRIPRQHVGGASNDIGVFRGEEGNLELFISDYDKGKYGQKFIDEIAKNYGLQEGATDAVNAGWEIINQTPIELNAPIPGLVGKVVGMRVRMPKSMVMQQ
jgi:hypothetical protein